jgi:FkbM family methyltransferase
MSDGNIYLLETFRLSSGLQQKKAPMKDTYSIEGLDLWIFYLTLGLNFLQNFGYTSGFGLTTRKRVLLAYLVKDSRDKHALAASLTHPEAVGKLRRLCQWMFLLSSSCRAILDFSNEGMEIRIKDRKKDYVYSMQLLPDHAKAEFVHDLYPLIDIFHLRSYDFYDVRNGTVIDVGAYIGDTAVYFARNGASMVVAYEPNPLNYRYLLDNIRRNGVEDKVRTNNSGVSKDKGILYVPLEASGAGSMVASKGTVPVTMSVVRPETIFDGLDRVTLLKLDCKGCEEHIIDDCGTLLHDKVEHLIMQFRDREGESNEFYLSKLQDNAFRLDKWDKPYGTIYLTNTHLL